ncbi:hypothetical protein KP509_26G013000 [Ceratopteris richardii]|nr:hypothetical protein KP509_26G013000 [Ceratopteris richardii]
MYIQCGCIEAARRVFYKLPNRDALTWNMMIFAYAKDDSAEEAINIFDHMQGTGIELNEFTYVGVFTAASNLLYVEKGYEVHSYVVKIGAYMNLYMYNALMDLYINCRRFADACHVFKTMDAHDEVSWNTLITGAARFLSGEQAFSFYRQMVTEGIHPNEITFLSLINACASIGDFELGKKTHIELNLSKINHSRPMKNTLIDMYTKCGSMKHAWHIFYSMSVKDEVAWNAILGGCARNGNSDMVILCFCRMTEEALCPNEVTFLSVLHACASKVDLKQVRQLHACMERSWVMSNMDISSRLLDTYAKCLCLDDAREIFEQSFKKNVVLWTAMIAACGRHGNMDEALALFCQMEQRGLKSNEVTFVSIVDACTSFRCLENGYLVHFYILEKGFEPNIPLENALIKFYSKLGCLADACILFDGMKQRDVVSYTILIAGFAENELYEKALKVFGRLVIDGVKPDLVTFTTVNHACANIAALEQGRVLHFYLTYITVSVDATVVSSVIDLYAKCGSLDDAHYIINTCADKDIISWNTLVSGCSQHGQVIDLPQLVNCMEKNGVRLNELTSLSLLSAYGRSGLVPQGICLFNYLAGNLTASLFVEHTACMVDLLGRAGCLDELMYLVQMMPFQPTATVWGALLGACKLHGLLELAEYASWEIIQLEPQNMAVFVVLSNMYATP